MPHQRSARHPAVLAENAALLAALGSAPDREIAEHFGLPFWAVQRLRKHLRENGRQLAVSQPKDLFKSLRPHEREIIGKISDAMAARALGVTLRTVWKLRQRLGIPPAHPERRHRKKQQ